MGSFAQNLPQQGVWTIGTPTADDHAVSVQPTRDGGLVIGGHTKSFGAGNWDFYVVKLDSAQQIQWTRTVGGLGVDNCFSVQQTYDGGYVAAGHTNSSSLGDYDLYVVRLDTAGELLWANKFGGSNSEFGFSMQQTSDSGYVVAGITNSYGVGGYDLYIVKLDATGNLQWTRTVGSSSPDEGRSVRQTSDGGYVIAGWTYGLGAGNADVYVIKLDSLGILQWTRTIGGPAADRGYSVRQTSDDGYVIAGSTQSFGAGNADMYVVRLDSSGDLLWTRTIGGPADDEGLSVQQTSDDGFIVAGVTKSFGQGDDDVYAVKLDDQGDVQWTRIITGGVGEDRGYQVYQSSDSGYVIGGYMQPFGAGTWDIYLVKLDAAGRTCGNTSSGGSQGSGGTVGNGGATSTGGAVATGGTAGSGGAISSECLDTGLGNAPSDEALSIHPNPANDKITITGIGQATVVVRDALGRNPGATQDAVGQTTLYTSFWPCGAYFIEVIGKDGSRSVHKVLIAR